MNDRDETRRFARGGGMGVRPRASPGVGVALHASSRTMVSYLSLSVQ